MTISDKPLVSVVIPCLNRAHFLVPTIESILQQDYPYVECIVVDGGSTDGTIEILKRYGDRIRWVSEPDNGHADAINKGWKMSKGEILAWLNADDVYAVPDAIRQAVTYFQTEGEIDVVYGDCGLIDEEGRVLSGISRPRPWDLEYSVRFCDHIIYQPSSFIRRRTLERIHWLDPSFTYGKDRDLWLRIGLHGKMKYAPVHFANERKCPGISQHGIRVSESCVKLTENFFRNPGLPRPYRSPRFQRRALSNAYLVGSLYAWDGGRHVKRVITYLCKSFSMDPLNLPHIFTKFHLYLVFSLLPDRCKRLLIRFLNCMRRSDSKCG